ncbi:hypothetical protein BJ322DRAFT_1030955 [Thelephora terrestris]|uniref:Uncharacterized protein n=1 Tax=Thelephora terrestris TaxID=56493 RepID=A0A9P6LD07_9AGAM|nr:hypothetical protein BJ322DRAFT_1030955 [Thelephora terrestris]
MIDISISIVLRFSALASARWPLSRLVPSSLFGTSFQTSSNAINFSVLLFYSMSACHSDRVPRMSGIGNHSASSCYKSPLC